MALQSISFNPKRFHRSQIKFHLILLPFAILMGIPIVYIINHAFKPSTELFAYPPKFFVRKPTLENFRMLFSFSAESGIPMSRYLFNSIVVSITVILLTLFLSSITAYALSKMEFRGKQTLNKVNTYALMFVPVAIMIPRFLIISQLGIYDTFWAHIIPVIAMPIGLFLIKQFMDQVPNELIEAAKMDGATNWTVYWKICLPLVKPALITVSVLAFQGAWGNMEASQTFIDKESLRTLPFYLNTIVSTAGSGGNVVASAGMGAATQLIMFIPNLIIFLFLQSKIMESMSRTGIK